VDESEPMPTLRVVMVSLHTSPMASPGSADAGGMNVVELNTALALGARGHQVDLLTRRDEPTLPDVVELAPGVRVHNLSAGPPVSVAKSAQEVLIEPFSDAMAQWWSLHGQQVDIIHSHHWFSGVAALRVARAAGVPHLQSYHSVAAPLGAPLAAGEQPESPGRPAGERLVAAESDRIVAVSQAEKATIIERYGPPVDRISVVRPGVDLEVFRPLGAHERHWAWDGCYLIFAARLQPLKGPDLAIRTLAELPVGHRPRLVVAGQTSVDFSWYAQQLRDLADELQVSDEVLFIGSQDRPQLAKLLRSACVLLNPSLSETFGLINLEASASGIPVIATRTGGMTESVVDGTTGLLLDTRDPRDWAQALRRFTDDHELCARFGAAGHQFAASRGWPVVAAEIETVYRGEVAR
jgi:D-inositol-3-phosphate glycosyltransferase